MLNLLFITNNPKIALIAEKYSVDRIMIDLEVIGKEERQRYMNTVKSHHTVQDIRNVAAVLSNSELMVRINPWYSDSVKEIEEVIAAGAQRIMLPMWTNSIEVDAFLKAVNRRVKTTLLLETSGAVDQLEEILMNPLIDEIHIGLNDLHMSYNLTFMFEPLSNGTVERICEKLKARKIPYGFGGIAKIGSGELPAEKIVMEHYRLGSTMAILSRSFCNVESEHELQVIEDIFATNIQKLREFEKSLISMTPNDFEKNREEVAQGVERIVKILGKKENSLDTITSCIMK